MMMVALAIMPIYSVHAEEVTTNITLTEDRTEQIVVPEGASVTLDLAGYNLSVADKAAIVNHGSLIIADSGRIVDGNTVYGTITAETPLYSVLATTPNSNTVINGGVFTGQYYVVYSLGSMTINNGTFHSTTNASISGANAALIHTGFESGPNYTADNYDIIDGVQYVANESSLSTLIINGGTFDTTGSTSTMCVKSVACTQLIVNGGTFTGLCGIQAWNKATINNGTFNSTGAIGSVAACGDINGLFTPLGTSMGKLVINGGTFTNTNENAHAIASLYNGATTEVFGGVFNGGIRLDPAGTDDWTLVTGEINVYGGQFTTSTDISSFIKGETTTVDGVITISTKSISTITKYVIYATAPEDVTFTYNITNVNGNETGDTILQEASKTADKTNEEVRDGITPSNVKFTNSGTNSTTLTFNVNDFNNGALVSSLTSPVLAAEDGSKYTNKAFTVDFSGVTWENPGIFRYVVTETSSNEKVPDSGKLYFDVWVNRESSVKTDEGYNKFKITSVIAHTDNALSYDSEKVVGDKTSYLTSTSRTKAMDLIVKHYADGNQASKTEEYTYTLKLTGATKGSTITWIKSDNTQGSITVDSTGAYTYNFKLKADQYITFKSISEDPGYEVLADEETMKAETLTTVTSIEGDGSDKYTNDSTDVEGDLIDLSPNAASETNISDSKYSITDTFMKSNTTVAFTIYKVGTIPTGVIVSVAPYAVVAIAGFAGIIVFATKKKRKEEDDDENSLN